MNQDDYSLLALRVILKTYSSMSFLTTREHSLDESSLQAYIESNLMTSRIN